jgi:hypothetical protein
MWIFQLHDDDNWSGKIGLPALTNPETIYYSDFYLSSEEKGLTKFLDFSMPNRIVFSLAPTILWNRFSKLIQDQNFHVPGSFDFTFSLMASLTCKFEYQSGFSYMWRNDNWNSTENSKKHLTGLAKRDGWKQWSSPEIANFNRSVDSLVALSYIDDFLNSDSLNSAIQHSLTTFQPSIGKCIKHLLATSLLFGRLHVANWHIPLIGSKKGNCIQKEQIKLHLFIIKTWKVSTIKNLIRLIGELKLMNDFEELQPRFIFWNSRLTILTEEK